MRTREPATPRHRPAAGFSLVELLVAIAIGAVIMTIGVPILQRTIERAKLEGQARTLSVLAAQARAAAITNNVETVVLFDGTEFVSFADLHGSAATDPPDGQFNPITGSDYRTTDWEVGRQPLADSLDAGGPSGDSAAVAGFTNPGRPDQRAIFNPDGSLMEVGAFRLRDRRGNFLEVRMEPKATGKVTLRKWDGSAWREQDEGGAAWEWK
jgi:prepilin-type N-terminal cleavage/methylation domain-containing protein